MRDFGVGRSFSVRVALGILLALTLAVVWSGVAHAQSADDQYDEPVSPLGPAAGAECTSTDQAEGSQVDAGDTLTCEGDFEVADGASAVVQDEDGTQGTFIDGQNAQITAGSIIIQVTGEPFNEVGGNGVLNSDCLFIAVTSGISGDPNQIDGVVECPADDGAAVDEAGDATAADEAGDATAVAGEDSEAQPASATFGVLPATGGPVLLGVLGVASLLGGALVAVRRHRSSGE